MADSLPIAERDAPRRMRHSCQPGDQCLGCTQDAALLIAAAVERERERIACAIEARRRLPYVIPSLTIVRDDALTVAASIARSDG